MLVFSYSTMAFFQSISVYYLSIIILGFGFGMTRLALASSLSLAQSPENQGSAAGYLGQLFNWSYDNTIYSYAYIRNQPFILVLFSSILCIGLIFKQFINNKKIEFNMKKALLLVNWEL